MLVRTEPTRSLIIAPGSWFYRGDNYSDAGGKHPGVLGRHRHRSPVTAYTLEGAWRYAEYDWIARPGDFVQENPGVIHTLIAERGMKTLFFVHGSLEFYDERDALQNTMDVFSFLDMYLRHCEERGLAVNERLFF